MSLRILALTVLAMIAFAANSVIGRLALIEGEIGAGSFAVIRLVSGAAILMAILAMRRLPLLGNWAAALALLIYAVFFSYAYIALPAGTGAIILFAIVQVTMIGWGATKGERPSSLQWVGLATAFAALIWLVSPGVEAPSLIASLSMVMAGFGWGIYSLLGRGAGDPTAMTAGNFIRASLLACLIAPILLLGAPEPIPSVSGVGLAVLSGAVTSGLGYVIWYAALKELSATRASIAQLSVPAIAALGGVLFLSEPITLRFALATALILSGVALATLTREARARKSPQ
ncbi:MAG: DMT family transporter [Pseudomonadota bacterium]